MNIGTVSEGDSGRASSRDSSTLTSWGMNGGIVSWGFQWFCSRNWISWRSLASLMEHWRRKLCAWSRDFWHRTQMRFGSASERASSTLVQVRIFSSKLSFPATNGSSHFSHSLSEASHSRQMVA
uniref:(northern house mosquito) hypothetical protein n=1 Tax=Culex pipiens TaxID=7175 RepID=A0A8D8EZ34_CULPI